MAAASGISGLFNNLLVNGAGPVPSLAAIATGAGIDIDVLDSYGLLDEITSDPAAYGLTDVTDPCLTGEVNFVGGTPCATPNQYLFGMAITRPRPGTRWLPTPRWRLLLHRNRRLFCFPASGYSVCFCFAAATAAAGRSFRLPISSPRPRATC